MSIKNRVKQVTMSCIAFAVCFKRIVRTSPDGTSKKSYEHYAPAIQNNQKISSPLDKIGPGFKFFVAYKMVLERIRYQITLDLFLQELEDPAIQAHELA